MIKGFNLNLINKQIRNQMRRNNVVVFERLKKRFSLIHLLFENYTIGET